jgi:predicted RNA-binding protein associated with RNAse of E/G family
MQTESLMNLTVIKCNHLGKEMWRYPARVISTSLNTMVIEAFFTHADMPFHGILLREGDRFIETYFNDRWYNILELHDKDDDALKGWYCNVCRPAIFTDDTISFDDLALDLLIYPDKSSLLLDENEFKALALDKNTRQACWQAIDSLKDLLQVIRPFQTPNEDWYPSGKSMQRFP